MVQRAEKIANANAVRLAAFPGSTFMIKIQTDILAQPMFAMDSRQPEYSAWLL
jgi:hypothetical protein